MKIDQLIFSIEKYFEDLIGFSIHGPLGVLIGMASFSLLIVLLRYKKKDEKGFSFHPNSLSDVGDPIEANLNLTRSLIEMGEFEKAKDCLDKVGKSSSLTLKQRDKAQSLRKRLKEK